MNLSTELQLETKDADFLTKYGFVSHVMAQCRNYRLFQILCQKIWIEPPILLRQAAFFINQQGTPAGYVTWAYLTPEVEARLLGDPQFALHLSEWQEGENVWIMDLAAPHGQARPMLRQLARDIFPHTPRLHYIRRSSDGRIRKRISLKNPYHAAAPAHAREGKIVAAR